MSIRLYKTLPVTFLVSLAGIVSTAAAETYTRTHGDTNVTTRASQSRHLSLLPFYINESVNAVSFTDSPTQKKIGPYPTKNASLFTGM